MVDQNKKKKCLIENLNHKIGLAEKAKQPLS